MALTATSLDSRVLLAAEAIRSQWDGAVATGIILGTGLGDLADEVDADAIIPYRDIPGFPRSTALAHKGRLICGRLAGAPVVVMQGRCHLYEGYPLEDLALPVLALCALGIRRLVVTNAAGGLNPRFAMGDVMLIDDHINLMWLSPLGRPDSCPLGRIARPAARLYDETLIETAAAIARRRDFPLHRGVYVGVPGPCYETRAEYRMFRRFGADCVGMSTVPEVLAASTCGMRVLGMSTVTNVALPDAPRIVSAEEVVDVAEYALPKVRAIILGVLADEASPRRRCESVYSDDLPQPSATFT